MPTHPHKFHVQTNQIKGATDVVVFFFTSSTRRLTNARCHKGKGIKGIILDTRAAIPKSAVLKPANVCLMRTTNLVFGFTKYFVSSSPSPLVEACLLVMFLFRSQLRDGDGLYETARCFVQISVAQVGPAHTLRRRSVLVTAQAHCLRLSVHTMV